eukprot:1149655-Alexandrium_andersonii.AAC.1
MDIASSVDPLKDEMADLRERIRRLKTGAAPSERHQCHAERCDTPHKGDNVGLVEQEQLCAGVKTASANKCAYLLHPPRDARDT